jgi:hypothetical protein
LIDILFLHWQEAEPCVRVASLVSLGYIEAMAYKMLSNEDNSLELD